MTQALIDTKVVEQFLKSLELDRHDVEDWPDDSRMALAKLRAASSAAADD